MLVILSHEGEISIRSGSRRKETYHVRGDLARDVANKQDRQESLELSIGETQVDVHVVDATIGQGVAVQKVEEVHEPEEWL